MHWRQVVKAVAIAAGVLAASAASADDRGRQRSPRSRAAAPAQATVPAEERRTFAVSRGSTLDVSNVAGDVRIGTERGVAIVVHAVRRLRGSGRRDDARLQDLRLEMSQVGNRVEVRARGSRSGRSSGAIDLMVSVPPDATVLARSVSGLVTLTGVEGEARLETVSGNVEAHRALNLAMAKSVSGDVTVRDVASAGILILGNVSGAVVATGVRARGLEAASVSGSLRLDGIAAQRVLAKAVSGDIDFGGALLAGGRFEFTSHSGDVRLRLPAAASFDLQADTYSGRLTSDFPVTLQSSRAGRSSRAIRGVAGDGAAQLIVRSFSGDVTIGRQ
jgi:hypothetical protein